MVDNSNLAQDTLVNFASFGSKRKTPVGLQRRGPSLMTNA
jgi:hypothetical protein